MCRSHADGGRLCPSQTDPKLIANRNARRRAAYAAKKTGSTKVEHAAVYFNTDHPVFRTGGAEGELFFQSSQTSMPNALGIRKTQFEGSFVDEQYFAGEQLSGQINYTKLDENSYKEFGFQAPDEERENTVSMLDIMDRSEMELTTSNDFDRKALAVYTTDAHEWINGAVYGEMLPNETEEDITEYLPDYKDEAYPYYDEEAVEVSVSHAVDITQAMDKALMKGPQTQRILYRGMNKWHNAFGDYKSPADYAKKNYPLGQEVEFDGYQSASISPTVAENYSSEGGVIFEVRTPSGVGVTYVSGYEDEVEVLLPRKSRYMVVGLHENVNYRSDDPEVEHASSLAHGITVIQMVEITDQGYIRDSSNSVRPAPLTREDFIMNPEPDDDEDDEE